MDLESLFNPEYTSGNLVAIDAVVQIIGQVAVWVISIVGFGIVMASILKNAVHGLYATNPKLFDKVYDIKQQGMNNGLRGHKDRRGNTDLIAGLGSLIYILCKLIPNVKALTDFAGDENGEGGVTLDPKAWFMRSLPLMVVQIFIGVLIFFGYPSKIAAWAAEFGTGVFDVVLTNVDPVAWVEAIPSNLTILEVSTSGAKDRESQIVNKITTVTAKRVLGKYSDIKKEARNDIAIDIETWVIKECLPNFHAYCGEDYTYSVSARITEGKPDLSRINSGANNDMPAVSEDTGLVTYAAATPVSRFVDGLTTGEDDTQYVRFDIVFTEVAVSGKKGVAIDVAVAVPNGSNTWQSDGKTLKVTLFDGAAGDAKLTKSGAYSVGGTFNGVSITIKAVDGNTIIFESAKDMGSCKEITDIKGLFYYVNGVQYPIRAIKCKGSETILSAYTAAGYKDWKWGEIPTKVSKEEATPTGNPFKE